MAAVAYYVITDYVCLSIANNHGCQRDLGTIKAIYCMGNWLYAAIFGNTCNTHVPVNKISTRRLWWSIIDTRIANITTNHWFVWIEISH